MKNKLATFLALNRSAPREYRLDNLSPSGEGEASIYLYDVIGYDWWSDGGVTAKQFADDLRALGSKTLNLHLNSPGGDVFEGRAMVAAMQSYPGKIVVHVDGLAASAASFLAMHADEIVMTDGSFLMIHNAWTMAMGDCRSMRETADLLEKLDGTIANDYLTRSTASAEQVKAWMDAETWFTAQDALSAGLCNRIAETRAAGVSARAKAWNLAAYDHPPAALITPEPEPEPDLSAEHAHEHRLRALRLAVPQLA